MGGLTKGTWVLVADGQKALFLRNDMDAQDPHLVVIRIEEQDNPADRGQATDRPGRMYDGGPGQRSALAETDFHQLAKERFADDLAEILYKQAHRGAFDRLVIVAPPPVLGDLRGKLHKEVASRVVAELDKTLTNHPLDKIEAMLKDELEKA
ncbi:host attachment family protein [Pararhodobacter aggregans]|uniref:Host attachment protein n=1 Tax=Pararhodobacter aggregans TaxID=404875 RepID=A0A2T7UNY1_9RHOB|nr:host attachment family protein [Pararhodobacter aggregans]PTX00829.1 protein required for attachment to host cells [Pararhodobacter aggregans]PVE46356.1 Host attachment protein [Pararhodobacter aggregans]